MRIPLCVLLCLNSIYLCSGASVNDEQFSTILQSGLNLGRGVKSCPEVPCADGFACVGNTCEDLCASVSCEANETCLYGQCYVNGTFQTCEDIRCYAGQECYYNQVNCLLPPCPPLPTCRSNRTDRCVERGCPAAFFCDQNTGDCIPEAEISCLTVKCSANFTCLLGRCQRDLCAGVTCMEGFECKEGSCLDTNSCPHLYCLPNCSDGRCQPQEKDCAMIRCPVACVDGKCMVPEAGVDPCATLECGRGTHCVNGVCELNTMDLCALTLCAVNTTCFFGECLPNGSFITCDNVRCKGGTQCVLEQQKFCTVLPCPPVPTCKPVVSTDRIGYNPPRKDF